MLSKAGCNPCVTQCDRAMASAQLMVAGGTSFTPEISLTNTGSGTRQPLMCPFTGGKSLPLISGLWHTDPAKEGDIAFCVGLMKSGRFTGRIWVNSSGTAGVGKWTNTEGLGMGRIRVGPKAGRGIGWIRIAAKGRGMGRIWPNSGSARARPQVSSNAAKARRKRT